jgi:hypothetical protein
MNILEKPTKRAKAKKKRAHQDDDSNNSDDLDPRVAEYHEAPEHL